MEQATKKCKYCQSDIDKKAKVCPVCKRNLKKGHGCLATIIGSVLFCVIISIFVSSPGSDNPDPVDTETKTEAKNDGYITMDEFNQIETGMSYDEVCDIIGSYGEVTAESEVGGYKVMIISWYGDGFTGANANVTFTNGEVSAKAQVGLN